MSKLTPKLNCLSAYKSTHSMSTVTLNFVSGESSIPTREWKKILLHATRRTGWKTNEKLNSYISREKLQHSL